MSSAPNWQQTNNNDTGTSSDWSRRRFCLNVAAGAASSGAVFASQHDNVSADAWTTRPVKVIVPGLSGGFVDVVTRILIKEMSSNFGATFLIDYQATGSGIIACQQLLRSEPDGRNWLVTSSSTHAILPSVNRLVGYDPILDFSHLAIFGGSPLALVVNADSRVSSWKEWLVQAKQAGLSGITIGSSGEFSLSHLVAQQLSVVRGFPWTHVPYRSTQGMLTDIVGGHLQAGVTSTTSAAGLIKSGRLRALLVTSTHRLPEYPQIPTAAELGINEVTGSFWFGLALATGVDPVLRTKIQRAVATVMAKPDWSAQLRAAGVEPLDVPVEAAGEFVAAQLRKWGPVARSLKIPSESKGRE